MLLISEKIVSSRRGLLLFGIQKERVVMFEDNEKIEFIRDALGTRYSYHELILNNSFTNSEKDILLRASASVRSSNQDKLLISEAYDIIAAKSFDGFSQSDISKNEEHTKQKKQSNISSKNKVGKILVYDQATGNGTIILENGEKKLFGINNWNDTQNMPQIGLSVKIDNESIVAIPKVHVEKTKSNQATLASNSKNTELLKFPNLPKNLEIGTQIVNWSGDAGLEGVFDPRDNTISAIPSGDVHVVLHTHGIRIIKGLTFFPLHNSQIISLKETTHGDLVKTNKSIIGRALLGGLILGPLGAVIGGMTGVGDKEGFVDYHYLIINYWDVKTKAAQTLLIRSKQADVTTFISRYKKEKLVNVIEKRQPEKESVTLGILILIAIVIFIIIIFF